MLISAMKNQARTQNDARSYASTMSSVLDFYSKAGAMRDWDEDRIVKTFEAALEEDVLLALKSLFWARDVRGGAGERRLFRMLFNWLAKNHPDLVRANLDLVSEYGRWDDVFCLLDTPVEKDMVNLVREQLAEDVRGMTLGEDVSLLAKWMPSENTSSDETVAQAKALRRSLHMTPRNYRRMLSRLRKHLNVVERYMSANEWDEISFEEVPSRASMIYRDAFARHAPDRYEDYLDAVESGEAEIKASTLYPYDLVRTYISRYGVANSVNRTVEAQWKALPNHLEGSENKNMMVVADTSGSMFSGAEPLPILISVSLALYTAERNRGIFNGYWINFSGNPTFQKARGDTLRGKVLNMDMSNWAMNTNLQSVFGLILESARMHSVPEEEMPRVVVIVSDMQFDRCVKDTTNLQAIKDQYAQYGYGLPTLVFWNVNAYGDQPVTQHESGAILVSGASPSVFRTIMECDVESLKNMTPYNMMLRTLNSERYEAVIV